MGTRSQTYIYDDGSKKKRKNCLVNMYRQMDGYPTGHGLELITFLQDKRMCNGITSPEDKFFNGDGCLAASIVAHFKTDQGGIYLFPPTVGPDGMLDYIYEIYTEKEDIIIECYSLSGGFNPVTSELEDKYLKKKLVFKGTANELALIDLGKLEGEL